ncbi:hypothetical protein FRX31_033435 [Thalictrum thalictroides]|uniref:Uncharacterized protein n=1 Tax=Thalictrum thalictroides TaxID=46969 RepID=A0A7J6UX15_THATH|nr:hypothetical protein FRX31_033435 [Thalictrum thalictroides]
MAKPKGRKAAKKRKNSMKGPCSTTVYTNLAFLLRSRYEVQTLLSASNSTKPFLYQHDGCSYQTCEERAKPLYLVFGHFPYTSVVYQNQFLSAIYIVYISCHG